MIWFTTVRLVSIHAPARGATTFSLNPYSHILVSIHAPARGATIVANVGETIAIVVSIHAPARGATVYVQSCHSTNSSFNPRTRTGCDFIFRAVFIAVTRFNPRTRTGCDKKYVRYTLSSKGFNPRTRTGCDLLVFCSVNKRPLFQSTHPHGVRQLQ